MIIAESSIHLSSQRTAVEEYHKQESLAYWKTGKNQTLETNNIANNDKSTQNMQLLKESVKVSLSAEALEKASSLQAEQIHQEEIEIDLNLKLLRAMIERITGKKLQFFKHIGEGGGKPQNNKQEVAAAQEAPPSSAGFGAVYDLHESYYEAESTSFSASGRILTADGVEVDFSVDVNMSREFYEEHNINLRFGDALKDPLVINFDGLAAALTQTKFSFDIDADGTAEQISFVTPESGFLVLDKNRDGLVTDGSELFGATTGDGFKELAVYDEDGNGWIDENDPIYQNLQIWVKNHTGEDQLFALGQKGVGAVFLGSVSSSFSMKTDQNEMLGNIRSSGVFLTEDYGIGTLQQVDLVI